MEIAETSDYLILFLITLAMVGFSRLFAYKIGLNLTDRVEQQERMQELQRELMEAQKNQNYQRVMELRDESMEMMQGMMKKQLLPMCVRSAIFLGLFAVLGIFYGRLEFTKNPIQIFGPGYASLYFVYSLGISLAYYLIRYLYRKLTGKEKEEKFVDRAQVLGSNINTRHYGSPNGANFQGMATNRQTESFDPHMQDLRQQLLEKRKRGELPADIDIDEELKRMTEETDNEEINVPKPKSTIKKSWKMKAASSQKSINIVDQESETSDKKTDESENDEEQDA